MSETKIMSISEKLQKANIRAGQVKPYISDLEKFTDLGMMTVRSRPP